ncbi:MAG: hypothetical protein IPL35_14325 [Sphingobacteriales bacterium]|nr:hypothetical protein [Sphingobacteriales bacterium]
MEQLKFNILCFLIILLMVFGCNNRETVINEPREIIIEWNNNLNKKNFDNLSELYGENVLYYGERKNKNACIRDKNLFMKKNNSFSQKIDVNKIDVAEQNPGIYECKFEKEVTISGISKIYPSYIVLKESDNKLKIITESDEITDYFLARKFVSELSIQGDFNGDGRVEKLSEVLFEPESKKIYRKKNQILRCFILMEI